MILYFSCGSVDGAFGPVRNPWKNNFSTKIEEDVRQKSVSAADSQSESRKAGDDFHISGGSSGGSAVAVATGSVFA